MDNSIFEVDHTALPKLDQVQLMTYLNNSAVIITVKESAVIDLKTRLLEAQKKIKDLELQLLSVRALLVEDKLPKKVRKWKSLKT